MAFDKSKFIARFAEEAQDHITRLNDGLVTLESNPGDTETLNDIFRSAHTIKGSSKILNLKEINQVAHKLEDTLDALRENKINQTDELFNLIFRAVDCIAAMVEKVKVGETPDQATEALCADLESASQGGATASPPPENKEVSPPPTTNEPLPKLDLSAPVPEKASPPPPPPSIEKLAEEKPQAEAPKKWSKARETVRINTDKLDETVKLMGEIVSNNIRMKQNLVDIDDIGKLSKKYLDLISRLETAILSAHPGTGNEVLELAQKVNVMVRQLSANTKDVMNFQNLLTDELREKVLKMRMLPLSTATDAFPRLVRDLASSCHKKIQFVVKGGETELDKKIVEKIGDPLLHMIRNSIDHGIETPEERVKAGKPETGSLTLTASYEGGNVLIELKDDGAGIRVDKIKEKALRKEMFSEEALNRMPKSEIVNLIFKAGFSTAPIITDLSGRGVGMDVVKENIVMQLKGSVQVDTEEGVGTTFNVRLPLTLAVMRVLLVAVEEFVYAVPLNSVREIIKVPEADLIDVVNRKAFSLREQIIPVVRLSQIMGLPRVPRENKKDLVVVLVAMGSETLGVIVDHVVSEEDMEIKPLPSHMKDNEMISGVTLSGKNEIVLVVQVPRMFILAKEVEERKLAPALEEEPVVKSTRLLVVDDSLSTREIERNILESHGYQVEVAEDGIDGLEKAQRSQFDLIITDIEMPRLDGFSLTEKLRELEEYQHTPIIIVSSRDRDEDKRRGMQVGADAYIIKGTFDQSNLLNTIESLVH